MTDNPKIRDIGNSKGVIIPFDILDALKLLKGDYVIITIANDLNGQFIKIVPKMIIEPTGKKL